MTADQALQYILAITAGVQANRDTHQQIIKALEILKEAITKKQ